MKSTSNFLTGFLLGVGAGMLVTPRSGKELRDQIEQTLKGNSSGGGDWKAKLNQVVDQVKSQVNQVKSQVQNKSTERQSDITPLTSPESARYRYHEEMDEPASEINRGL